MLYTLTMLGNKRSKFGKQIFKSKNIDNFTLRIFKLIIADFWVEDKIGRLIFFEEIFLVANIKFDVILKMPFFQFRNSDILFGKKTPM